VQDPNEGQPTRLDSDLDQLLDLSAEQRQHALHHDYRDQPLADAGASAQIATAIGAGIVHTLIARCPAPPPLRHSARMITAGICRRAHLAQGSEFQGV